VNPTSIKFGQVYLYSPTREEPVTVKNIGGSTLTLNSVTLSGTNSGDYEFVNGCSPRLAAGSSCIIKVYSYAKQVGTLSAELNIAYNAAGSPQHVMLQTTVIHPEASFSPYRLNFGTVAVGHEVTADVTVTSTGTTALDISKLGVTGADASNFKPTSHCPSSLAPSDSCTIAVTFTPSTTGSRTATLAITDNVSEGSPHDVPLLGTGGK
jgi:hypothetical protein